MPTHALIAAKLRIIRLRIYLHFLRKVDSHGARLEKETTCLVRWSDYQSDESLAQV